MYTVRINVLFTLQVTGKFYKVMNSDGDGIKDAVISFQFVLDDLEERLTEAFFCGKFLDLKYCLYWEKKIHSWLPVRKTNYLIQQVFTIVRYI